MEVKDSNKLGVVYLDKTHKHKRNPKKTKKINLVRNKLTDEDKKSIKYSHLEPLYNMWCEYYNELLGSRKNQPDERMLKADYHGALLMVAEADNPTMAGIVGIVVLETRHTFQLITKQDKYVVIPKQGTAFQFILNGHVFTIFGDAMRYKPSLRGRKQRLRISVPFFIR